MQDEYEPTDVMNRESRSNRYYRNAVERHWDPHDIDLEQDRQNLLEFLEQDDIDQEDLDQIRTGLAMFGAGEDAVTEDLAPQAVVHEDIDDQMFLTTQLYEEAKHADFFDRYWRNVIHVVEDEMGWDRSSPRADHWFNDDYHELFDRNRKAQYRLLEEDTPETRAKAYCHYHLTVEGILAQTGYFAMHTAFGDQDNDKTPYLPGLVEGFSNIRSDEGRHVGFGMGKLKDLISQGSIEPQVIDDTVNDLLPLVVALTGENDLLTDDYEDILSQDDMIVYAQEKHSERMEQIKDAESDIPEVDDLTQIESTD